MPKTYHLLLLSGLAGAIFAADLLTELGVATGVLYVTVVSLTYSLRDVKWVWGAACACSVLALAGLALSPPGGKGYEALLNRALSLVVIWAAALPSVRLIEESLARRRLSKLVESSTDAIVGHTMDGVIVSWNRGAEKLYGYRAEELIGESAQRLTPPEGRAELERLLARLRRGECVERLETVRLGKGGRRVHVSLTLSVIEDAAGRASGVCAVACDITKRKRQEQANLRMRESLMTRTAELAGVNAALEHSNRELQQFAFVASHDLQTPLRAIAGFAQVLEEDYAEAIDETGKQHIERIVRGARRMQELVDDVLELSRIESRCLPFEPVPLHSVFEEVLELLHESLADSRAEVSCDTLPTVLGDRVQLRQLLQNLVENALKYRSRNPPRIRVGAYRKRGLWTIAVRDNGIGIEPQHHEKIFEIFRRLHRANDYPGTGIGLAVCRRIVDRHGGRIWVESRPGGGSAFLFTIAGAEAPALPGRRRQHEECKTG